MLLSAIYVGTAAASIIIDLIAADRLKRKIKIYGYKKTAKKKFSELNKYEQAKKIMELIAYALLHVAPVLNVVTSFYVIRTLNDAEIFKEYLETKTNEGELEKITTNNNKVQYIEPVNIPLFERRELMRRAPKSISKPKMRIKSKED